MLRPQARKKGISPAITLVIAAIFSGPRIAIGNEDLLNLPLEELLKIKVSASTLTKQSLKTIPASITLFTRTQIQQLGINNLEKLMNYVPGYQSYRSDAGFVNYSSRSRRLSNSTCEVLVLLDGQRLDHDAFCGMSPTDGDFSLHNVERVEFLRGPGSAIYGANAILGVVNIITADNKNNMSVSRGNHHQERVALHLSQQFAQRGQMSIAGQSDRADTGQSRVFDPLSQRFATGHQQQNELHSIYARASWGDWSLQARHSSKLIENGYGIGNISDHDTALDAYSNLLAVNYSHTLNPQWKLDSRVYNTPYRAIFRGRTSAAPVISIFTFTGRELGIENHATWQQDKNTAIIGADLARLSITDASIRNETVMQTVTTSATLADDNRHMKAIYGQWQNTFSDRFSYIVGIRHDHYSDVAGRSSPRAGLIYQQSNENTLKLLYGEAFRVPTRIELYLKNNPAQTGNPELAPEIAKTAELIWMYSGHSHYLSISLFDTLIKNPVELSNTVTPRLYINGNQQHMSGIELESKWELNDNWQIDSALSHIFNSPMAINSEAEDLISSSLIYTSEKFTLSFSGNYHGTSRDADHSALGYHTLGGFTLFDMHTQYQLTPEWNLYMNIRNLSDKDYYQPAFQNGANIYGVPGTGRAFELGLRWTL